MVAQASRLCSDLNRPEACSTNQNFKHYRYPFLDAYRFIGYATALSSPRPRVVATCRDPVHCSGVAQFIHDGAFSMAYQSTLPTTLTPTNRAYLRTGVGKEVYVDYKATDDLRRLMTPNGKIYSRKRLAISAREQRMISQAIKRARHMALLPYTNATL